MPTLKWLVKTVLSGHRHPSSLHPEHLSTVQQHSALTPKGGCPQALAALPATSAAHLRVPEWARSPPKLHTERWTSLQPPRASPPRKSHGTGKRVCPQRMSLSYVKRSEHRMLSKVLSRVLCNCRLHSLQPTVALNGQKIAWQEAGSKTMRSGRGETRK